MNKSKMIICYLKGSNKAQSVIKQVANINTTKYHDILKEKDTLSEKELERLTIVFPELDQIKGE